MAEKLDALIRANSLPVNSQDSEPERNLPAWGTVPRQQRLQAHRPVAELAIAMNIEQSFDQTDVLFASLLSDGWTVERVHRAVSLAKSSREALREIKFAGAITPLVLMEAEHASEEAESPVLGKCFTPYCNREARVREWGEVYCKPCHTTHMEKVQARKARFAASMEEHAGLLASRERHLELMEAKND